MTKSLWVDASGDAPWDERKTRVTEALESGAEAVLVNPGEENLVKELGTIAIIGKDIKAEILTIKNKEDELNAAKLARDKTVVVSTTDWTIIPLENLIASKQKGKGTLIASVASLNDAKVAIETLESGVDGVLFRGPVPDIKKAAGILEKMGGQEIKLLKAKITKVKVVGMGDRVCVDTCSLFSNGEGMLVGSSSSGLFLVHAETIESPYVAARPFRVNAGTVHAYTLLSNGKTTYLSELEGGDEVMAVDSKGNTRAVVIGRMKIEKRPLLHIEASVSLDGVQKTIKTILQNAETIRLTTPEGKALSVSKLKEGDEVLAYVETGGRHFGMAIEESINEK